MRALSLSLALLISCAEAGDPDACDATVAAGWSLESHTDQGAPDYERLFDDGQVLRIDVAICPEDHQAMRDDLDALYLEYLYGDAEVDHSLTFLSSPPTYMPATVRFQGRSWPKVGIRYKGNSSLVGSWERGVEKLPFRLNFDRYEDDFPEVEDQRFWGFEEIKFSNNYNDASMIRDRMASETFRAAGVPAARGAFARVYVDMGEGPVYWGLYTLFETPCDTLLASWFGEDDGACYKADGEAADLAVDEEGLDTSAFELQSGLAGHADVQALVDALAADRNDPEDWRDELEAAIDMDAFLRYQAANNLIRNWDVYGVAAHNYYLYDDAASGTALSWIPWDFNSSYGTAGLNTISLTLDEITPEWPLIRHAMDDTHYRAVYYDHLAELLDGPFALGEQQARMLAYHRLIAPYVTGEDGEAAPYTHMVDPTLFEISLEGNSDSLFLFLEAQHDAAEQALAGQ